MKKILSLAFLTASLSVQADPIYFVMTANPNGAVLNPDCELVHDAALDYDNEFAFLTLSKRIVGTCDLYVDPTPVTYILPLQSASCGSIHATYYPQNPSDLFIAFQDNRGRLCKDIRPGQFEFMVQYPNGFQQFLFGNLQ